MSNGNIPMHINEASAKTNNSFEKFTQQDSGWTLHKISNLEVSSANLAWMKSCKPIF